MENESSPTEECTLSLVSDPPTVWTQKVSIAQQSSIFLELVCWVEANPPCQPQWIRIEEEEEVNIVNLGKSSRLWVENIKQRIPQQRFMKLGRHFKRVRGSRYD